MILDGLKKRLEDKKGRWVHELPSVLWAFRTTPRRSTGDTPYSLTYGTDAIIPLEIGLPIFRTALVGQGDNDRTLEEALDFAESRRETASIHLANYQSILARQQKSHTRPR